ncbi:hypothetical protein V2J09_010276 [Rumex salicifolius]
MDDLVVVYWIQDGGQNGVILGNFLPKSTLLQLVVVALINDSNERDLLIRGVVLTNEERVRRHLTNEAICAICNKEMESEGHLFRDCEKIRDLWRTICLAELTNFFQTTSPSRIRENLCSSLLVTEGEEWSVIFAMAVWWIWRWRNDHVFGNIRSMGDKVAFIREKVKE